MSLTLLGLFLLLSFLGIPLAVALGLASVATIALFTSAPIDLLAQSMFSAMNSFLMVAVPLFILVGVLMDRSGVADRIFDFASSLVGWLPGGMGHVNIVSSVIFSGISGSSVADITSIGALEIRAMERHGFDKGYAVGMTLVTSTLSSVIPPSILMILAGSIANVSVGTLLIAGFIPGLFIAGAFMVFNHFYSKYKGYGHRQPLRLRSILRTGVRALLPALTPVILMAGILAGYFTPTEAAGVAVLYILTLATVVYGDIKFAQLPGIFVEVARISGTILLIAATARLAAWVFTYDSLPVQVAAFLSHISKSPTVVLVLVFLFLVVVGMFMDAIAAMFILIPVLMPPMVALGVDPIHFLVVVVLTLTLGLVTPPVGVCLYAVAQVAGMPIETVIRTSFVPVLVLTLAIVMLVVFPALTLAPIRFFGLY